MLPTSPRIAPTKSCFALLALEAERERIDAVESKSDPNRGGREHGNALAAALGIDMANWYRPTAAGYFGRIGKAAIISDLEAMRQSPAAPAWLKLKKAELAALAECQAAQAGWLRATAAIG